MVEQGAAAAQALDSVEVRAAAPGRAGMVERVRGTVDAAEAAEALA